MLTPNQVKWVEALESGKYPQTGRVLTRLNSAGEPTGHCCLGVACELAIKDGVAIEVGRDTASDRTYDCYTTELPPNVRLWLDVGSSIPMIGKCNAVDRNDTLGQSFAEIASAIREYGVK